MCDLIKNPWEKIYQKIHGKRVSPCAKMFIHKNEISNLMSIKK